MTLRQLTSRSSFALWLENSRGIMGSRGQLGDVRPARRQGSPEERFTGTSHGLDTPTSVADPVLAEMPVLRGRRLQINSTSNCPSSKTRGPQATSSSGAVFWPTGRPPIICAASVAFISAVAVFTVWTNK